MIYKVGAVQLETWFHENPLGLQTVSLSFPQFSRVATSAQLSYRSWM